MSDEWHYVEIEYRKEVSPFQLGRLYERADTVVWEGVEDVMVNGGGMIDGWSKDDTLALFEADYQKLITVIRWQHETEWNNNDPFSLRQVMTREQYEARD